LDASDGLEPAFPQAVFEVTAQHSARCIRPTHTTIEALESRAIAEHSRAIAEYENQGCFETAFIRHHFAQFFRDYSVRRMRISKAFATRVDNDAVTTTGVLKALNRTRSDRGRPQRGASEWWLRDTSLVFEQQ
jgi:hypothetical protein